MMAYVDVRSTWVVRLLLHPRCTNEVKNKTSEEIQEG